MRKLQQDCLNSRITVTELLRSALVLASEYDDKDFATFVSNELTGYPGDVPEYRRVIGELKGEASRHVFVKLQITNLTDQTAFCTRNFTNSIPEIEKIISDYTPNGMITLSVPEGAKNMLRQTFRNIGDIVFEIGISPLIAILEIVRTKISQWCVSKLQTSQVERFLEPIKSPLDSSTAVATKPFVFIASSTEGLQIAQHIQLNIERTTYPTIWNQGVFQISSTTIDDLISQAKKSDFGIFVFSPDDILNIRSETTRSIRDNVLFEMGLFVGTLGKSRVFAVKPRGSDLHIPTDLLGITIGEYEPNRPDQNITAALGPFCTQIAQQMAGLTQ